MKRAALLLLAACGSSTPGTGAGDGKTGDGKGGGGPADAAPTGTAKAHVIYINAGGQAVMSGSEDATLNQSPLVASTATLAASSANMSALVSELGSILAPYGAFVVTSRPAAGPYHMVIVTDDNGSKLGSINASAPMATSAGCNAHASPVSFVFLASTTGTHDLARRVVTAAGLAAGIPATTPSSDCMCFSCANGLASACAIGGAGTTVATQHFCLTPGPTIDEAAAFRAAFGAR